MTLVILPWSLNWRWASAPGMSTMAQRGALLLASISERRISNYTRNVLTFADQRWTSMPVNAGRAVPAAWNWKRSCH
jgi:hypothetical protein